MNFLMILDLNLQPTQNFWAIVDLPPSGSIGSPMAQKSGCVQPSDYKITSLSTKLSRLFSEQKK